MDCIYITPFCLDGADSALQYLIYSLTHTHIHTLTEAGGAGRHQQQLVFSVTGDEMEQQTSQLLHNHSYM